MKKQTSKKQKTKKKGCKEKVIGACNKVWSELNLAYKFHEWLVYVPVNIIMEVFITIQLELP